MRKKYKGITYAESAADENNEGLRAEIHKLRYELDSLKQERELTAVRHDEDLRNTRSKADADYKRAQVSN